MTSRNLNTLVVLLCLLSLAFWSCVATSLATFVASDNGLGRYDFRGWFRKPPEVKPYWPPVPEPQPGACHRGI